MLQVDCGSMEGHEAQCEVVSRGFDLMLIPIVSNASTVRELFFSLCSRVREPGE